MYQTPSILVCAFSDKEEMTQVRNTACSLYVLSLCVVCADEINPSGGSHSNRIQEGQRLGSGSSGSGSRGRLPPARRFADRSKVGAEEPEDGDNKQGGTRGGRGGRRGGGRGGLSRGGGSGAVPRNGKREFDRRSGSDKRCVV